MKNTTFPTDHLINQRRQEQQEEWHIWEDLLIVGNAMHELWTAEGRVATTCIKQCQAHERVKTVHLSGCPHWSVHTQTYYTHYYPSVMSSHTEEMGKGCWCCLVLHYWIHLWMLTNKGIGSYYMSSFHALCFLLSPFCMLKLGSTNLLKVWMVWFAT